MAPTFPQIFSRLASVWNPAIPKPHPKSRDWRAEGRAGWLGFGSIVLQLAIVVGIVQWLELEGERGFTRASEQWWEAFDPVRGGLLALLTGAFLVHALLPARWKMPFFLVVSMAGCVKMLGWVDGGWLILLVLFLVGICHLPLAHGWKVGLVFASGVVLGLLRAGMVASPIAVTVLPVLGSMMMFRIIVYLYDIRNERVPVDPWRRLSYFFLAPNVCFPIFPVVDYTTFLRTWRDDRDLKIYQKGVLWMSRGAIHLILYRLIYQHLSPAPEDVEDLADVLVFVISSYLLYLRISGQFHLIIGVLCLFGFNLPETHRRYLLASGFSDYWRRINIYWKDFMMKTVFYPCYVRFKSLGQIPAIALGTAAVFLATWFLHAYQWFWLRGVFHFSLIDGVFWIIFALLVIVNAVHETAKSPAKRPAVGGSGFDWKGAVKTALQTAAMFALICLLFSFWQSQTVGEFLSVMAQAGNTSLTQVAGIGATVLAALAVGVFVQWPGFRGTRWRAEERTAPGWSAAVATILPLALLASLGAEPVRAVIGDRAGGLMAAIRGGGSLNERDQRRLDRGYYEGLLKRETFGSQLWEVRLKQRPDWKPEENNVMFQFTGDILEKVLVPNQNVAGESARWITNRWSMHDHDHYEQKKPEGVFRIAMLGASYGAGSGMSVDNTFENLVEDALNRHPGKKVDRIEILNFSAPGYTLIEFVAFLETRIAAFEPDCFMLVTHSKEGPRTLGTLSRRIRDGVPLTYEYLEGLREKAEIPENPTDQDLRRLSPFRHEIEDWGYGRMVDFCRDHQMLPVWIHLPATDETVDLKALEAQRQVAEDKGFVTILLDKPYGEGDPSEIWLFPHDRHPNAEGHRRIAVKMLDEILAKSETLNLPLGEGRTEIKLQSQETAP